VIDRPAALAAAVLSFTLYQCGEPGEALEVATRAVEVAAAAGDAHAELIMGLSSQGSALGELERPEESIEIYRRALATVHAHEDRLRATLGGNLAVALGSVGRFAESVLEARQAVLAGRRAADRFFERWARLVLGRSLCSLGEWDAAIGEIDAVRADVPPFQLGMAMAPLVTIALGRADGDGVAALIAEYDRRCAEEGTSVFEPDFRALRAAGLAIVAGDEGALGRVIPEAEVADYVEWSGWVAPIVDRLVELPDDAPLVVARAALQGPGRMKRTAPIAAQSERLAAHLARRSGDLEAARAGFERAEQLAAGCGMRRDSEVIARERAAIVEA
jgi:tetratricopeptide (TPR) repeat protein